jgi:hypothetical protein
MIHPPPTVYRFGMASDGASLTVRKAGTLHRLNPSPAGDIHLNREYVKGLEYAIGTCQVLGCDLRCFFITEKSERADQTGITAARPEEHILVFQEEPKPLRQLKRLLLNCGTGSQALDRLLPCNVCWWNGHVFRELNRTRPRGGNGWRLHHHSAGSCL